MRDHIYQLVTERDKPVHISCAVVPRLRPNGELSKKSPFAALLHICRQIRTEYQFIFYAEACISVGRNEVLQYLDTFHGDLTSRTALPKSLTIFLPLIVGSSIEISLDILPLLRRLMVAGNSCIQFEVDTDIQNPVPWGTRMSQYIQGECYSYDFAAKQCWHASWVMQNKTWYGKIRTGVFKNIYLRFTTLCWTVWLDFIYWQKSVQADIREELARSPRPDTMDEVYLRYQEFYGSLGFEFTPRSGDFCTMLVAAGYPDSKFPGTLTRIKAPHPPWIRFYCSSAGSGKNCVWD